MRMRLANAVFCGGLLWLSGGSASAQVNQPSGPTFGPNGPYAPNFYNRQSQPLSPYLNLLRGGNPAVNYFYGVRPGTVGGNYAGAYGYGGAANVQRQTFFPYVDTLAELEPTDPRSGMPPTGHPSGFNNTLGYYGPLSGAAARAGQAGQGQQGMGGRKAVLQPPRR